MEINPQHRLIRRAWEALGWTAKEYCRAGLCARQACFRLLRTCSSPTWSLELFNEWAWQGLGDFKDETWGCSWLFCWLRQPVGIRKCLFFFFNFLCFILFFFFLKLYIIVLVLPNIKMNLPQVYMCSPSWTLLPPHTIPLGRPSALAPSIQYRAWNLDWQLVSYMIFYMFQCHSPKSSHPLSLPQSP